MARKRPPQIHTHHLQRLAVIYIRQSTPRQQSWNHSSIAYQRSQINFALTWGWLPERIVVIDEDLGQSGTTAKGREGFQRLLRLVDQGQVGGIFCTHLSRLSRGHSDLDNLVGQCRLHRTLLISNDQIIDLHNSPNHLS